MNVEEVKRNANRVVEKLGIGDYLKTDAKGEKIYKKVLGIMMAEKKDLVNPIKEIRDDVNNVLLNYDIVQPNIFGELREDIIRDYYNDVSNDETIKKATNVIIFSIALFVFFDKAEARMSFMITSLVG